MKKIVLASTQNANTEFLSFLSELFSDVEGLVELEGNIQIATCETFNNAVVHGNKLNPKKFVTCTFDTTDTQFVFTIEDEGDGFDPSQIPDPTLPENIEKTEGRGVFLTKIVADEVRYLENSKKVVIVFDKKK
jgi:anti-sigma regulatory factor